MGGTPPIKNNLDLPILFIPHEISLIFMLSNPTNPMVFFPHNTWIAPLLLACFMGMYPYGGGRLVAEENSTENRFETAELKEMVFEEDVVPIMRAYCWRCHGLEGRHAELDLRTMPLINQGGRSGAVVVPGSSEQSLLYQVLSPGERQEEHERGMQQVEQQTRKGIPRRGIRPTEKHGKVIAAWIETGAKARYTAAVLLPEQAPPLPDGDRQ